MAEQDAQDINQMMSATADVAIGQPKKSKFLWIVLGCVVVGVGLGVVVYQQSLKSVVKPSPTPRPTVAAKPSPIASPIPSPVLPDTNVVNPATNTITFSKAGKLRIYSDLSLAHVVSIVIGGQTKTITLPARTVNATTPMNFTDSTFEVTAGSTGTISVNLTSASGAKMRGWMSPADLKTCGANGATVVSKATQLAFVQAKLAGESIFSYQCWEDDDTPGEFNDFYMLWTYAPPTSSPAASSSPTASASPVASKSPSPSPSASVKASASPSVAASSTPTPSPRVSMPDTTDGTPVTGVFEVTVGTISIGLILLILGLFGLLAL
jgi:hypothetical protein